MIRINLLPTEMSKRGGRSMQIRGPKPSVMVVGVLVLAYAAVALLAGVIAYSHLSILKERDDAKEEKQKIETQIAEIQERFTLLKKMEDLMSNQIEILKALNPPNRIIWSEKIHMIASMIPENVYITDMTMWEEQTQVPTQESLRKQQEWENTPQEKRQGEKPEKVMKPLIVQNMSIEGIARAESDTAAFKLAVDFQEEMERYQHVRPDGKVSRFKDSFARISMGTTAKDKVGDVDVYRFTIQLKTNPFISQE